MSHSYITSVEAKHPDYIIWLKCLLQQNLFFFFSVEHNFSLVSRTKNGYLRDCLKLKFLFLQEQLRYKSKFNFVTFDGQAIAWREKLAEVNEDNLKQAQSWIRGIKVQCVLWWTSVWELTMSFVFTRDRNYWEMAWAPRQAVSIHEQLFGYTAPIYPISVP